MSITTIPLNQLTASEANVRKTGGTSIDDLAASIAANGLLQNLTVIEGEKGKYAVVAGGRRFKALKKLAKEKAIAKDFPVPCLIRTANEAGELSLTENTIREAMHPADRYEAFKQLADEQHLSPADIAARFGTSETQVTKLLKLGRVAPDILDAYRADEIDLSTVMAFTLTDHHELQTAAYQQAKKAHRMHHYFIREMLTNDKISTDDRRVKFIGLDAYEAAGGTVTRDLFSEEGEGYLDNPLLMMSLVTDKLTEAAKPIEAEGWKWVEIHAEDFPSLYGKEYRQTYPGPKPSKKVKTNTGVLIGIGHNGELKIEKGILRKGDKLPTDKADAPEGTDATPEQAKPDLGKALLEDLTAHRTMAMRACLADSPDVAFDALLYSLAAREFYGTREGDLCARISIERVFLGQRVEGTPGSEEMARQRDHWASQLPGTEEELWDWLSTQAKTVKMNLLAYLVATSIDVTQRGGSGANLHGHQLHHALQMDMTRFWQPTAENYFDRVKREQIVAALTEMGDTGDHSLAKKKALAQIAERKVEGTGWLPKPLRMPEMEDAAPPANDDQPAEEAA